MRVYCFIAACDLVVIGIAASVCQSLYLSVRHFCIDYISSHLANALPLTTGKVIIHQHASAVHTDGKMHRGLLLSYCTEEQLHFKLTNVLHVALFQICTGCVHTWWASSC